MCNTFDEAVAKFGTDEFGSHVIAVARAMYHIQGEVEIDSPAVVSGNSVTDEGWYVSAWVWVPKEAVRAG